MNKPELLVFGESRRWRERMMRVVCRLGRAVGEWVAGDLCCLRGR
jgi:hypothetical protein